MLKIANHTKVRLFYKELCISLVDMNIQHALRNAMNRLRNEITIKDLIFSIFIIFIDFIMFKYPWNRIDGLITQGSIVTVIIVRIVIASLICVRKIWPSQVAIIFICVCIIHLLLGPSLLFDDFLGFILLSNVISRGKPEHSRAFVIAAYITTILSAISISWSIVIGSFLGKASKGIIYACKIYNPSANNPAVCTSIIFNFALPSVIFAIIATTITVIIGYWQRSSLHFIKLLQENNATILANRKHWQHITVTSERARIAREMHDIVAHTLSIIIVQSDGGRYAASHDIPLAKKTMIIIKNEAERAINDMKKMLKALSETSSHEDNYSEISSLIEQARVASPNNIFWHTVDGKNSSNMLDSQAQAVAYRVIQEALSNIRKHAGDSVRVKIHEQWDLKGLTLIINNEINKNGSESSQNINSKTKHGYGLIGMKERLERINGKLTSGKLEDGSFNIIAFIPYSYQNDKATLKLLGNRISEIKHSSSRIEATSSNLKTNPINIENTNKNETQTLIENSEQNIKNIKDTGKGFNSKKVRSENNIEKISQWMQQHWLIGDIICYSPWLILFLIIPTYDSILGNTVPYDNCNTIFVNIMYRVFTLTTIVPMMFRRKAPTACAIIVSICSALQLIFLQNIIYANLTVPAIIYASVLYGKKNTWKWVSAATLVECTIFGIKTAISSRKFTMNVTLFQFFDSKYNISNFYDFTQIIAIGLIIGFLLSIVLFIVIAFAYYKRNDNNNLLLLKTRKIELEKEQQQLQTLIANAERQRISANIQQEVSVTLHRVINAANNGISMLNEYEKAKNNENTEDNENNNEDNNTNIDNNNNIEANNKNNKNNNLQPSNDIDQQKEDIEKAFKNIGSEGRSALKYMRNLLGILRETGSSDEAINKNTNVHNSKNNKLVLHPASSIDEQIQHSIENKQQ